MTHITIHIQNKKYLEEAERWATKLGLPLILNYDTALEPDTAAWSGKHLEGANPALETEFAFPKELSENTLAASSIALSNSFEDNSEEQPEDIPNLRLDDFGLSLCQGSLSVRGDFTRMIPRIRPANLHREFLVKAGKFRDLENPTVLDATAGLGEDSILLAAAGFRVHLYEYNPIIAALLEDAMRRAERVPELTEAVSRMTLHTGDSIQAMENPLKSIGLVPDMVLLDPMFPKRHKSALVKKKFQLLQKLEAPCSTEEELLQAALRTGTRKVVIKRPLKGPYLAGKKPSYSISGKAIRYDCIVIPRNE